MTKVEIIMLLNNNIETLKTVKSFIVNDDQNNDKVTKIEEKIADTENTILKLINTIN